MIFMYWLNFILIIIIFEKNSPNFMDWDEEYSRANKFRISHMGPKT